MKKPQSVLAKKVQVGMRLYINEEVVTVTSVTVSPLQMVHIRGSVAGSIGVSFDFDATKRLPLVHDEGSPEEG